MEFLILLLVLAVLSTPIIALILAIQSRIVLNALHERIEHLERQVSQHPRESAPAQVTESSEVVPPTQPAAEPEPSEPLPPPTVEAEPYRPHKHSVEDILNEDKASVGLEQRLGANLFVWIGAVAIALAATFLVKYSFDRNLLTPIVRICLGLGSGVALLALGELLRRRYAKIAQGLTATGVAVLFSSLWAGTNLYSIFSPVTGFALMAAVTAVAVALSLRQGPFVALLGLVGGYLTPALVHAEQVAPSVFAYLLMLELGLLAVTFHRGWALLAAANLIACMGWAGFWLLLLYEPQHSIWVGSFILASVTAFVLTAQRDRTDQRWNLPAFSLGMVWGSSTIGLLLIFAYLNVNEYSLMEWAFYALLGAGCLLIGRFDTRVYPLPWLAAAVGCGQLLVWYASRPDIGETDTYTWMCVGLGALHALGAYMCLWGSDRPQTWIGLSTLSSIAYFLIGYFTLENPPLNIAWGIICLILAGLNIAAAVPVGRFRRLHENWDKALACAAAGAIFFLGAAAPIELEHEWIAIAWALMIPAIGLVDRLFKLPRLYPLVLLLGGLVIFKLVLTSELNDRPLGPVFLWNWTLHSYGLPALALACGAWLFGPAKNKTLIESLTAGAVFLGFMLIGIQVRHFFHRHDITVDDINLKEAATYVNAWLLYALALFGLARRLNPEALAWAGRITTFLATFTLVIFCGLIQNPLWKHQAVGAAHIVNWLLYIYGLPAILLLLVARERIRDEHRGWVRLIASTALALIFLTLSLQVRQYFQGTFLDSGSASNMEWYTYSAAWIIMAITLLIMGIVTGGVVLRYGSLVIMLVSVGKVFLSDTAHLTDLYRVFSLLGLGISLFLIAFLYQKFVFQKAG